MSDQEGGSSRRVAWFVLCLVGLLSCDQAVDRSLPAVIDSAGLRIIRNPAPGVRTPQWLISKEPLVVVGDDAVAPLHRVGGVLLLSNGGIVVTNNQTELLYFDRSGSLIRKVGGRGDGPAEFRQLNHIAPLSGDSVIAFNSWPPHVTVFDNAGGFRRQVRFDPPPDRIFFLLDGSWAGGHASGLLGRLGAEPRLVEERYTLIRYTPEGGVRDTITQLRGRQWFGTASSFGGVPFSPAAVFSSSGDRVYAGWSGHFVIRVFDAATTEPIQDIRVEAPPIALNDNAIARATTGRPRGVATEGGAYNEPPIPEAAPFFDQMLPGPDGELWVSAYSPPGDEERQWYVFGEDGFLKALLRVPAAFRLVDARRDIVAGVWTDELGVQMVKVYALARD